jgi:hypothetical protein
MLDPQVQKEKLEKLAKIGLFGVGLAVTAPIAFYAVQGLVAWGIVGLGYLVYANFVPAIADQFAVWRMKSIIAIAEANPIETMLGLYKDKKEELVRAESNITTFDTEVRNVLNLVADLKKTDPDEAVEYAKMASQMELGLNSLKDEHAAAASELDKFKGQIDKAKRIWKVANAMNSALAASQSAQAQVFADIKEQVAFDTVRNNLNRAFANLNTAVDRRKTAISLKQPKAAAALPEATPAFSEGVVLGEKAKVLR